MFTTSTYNRRTLDRWKGKPGNGLLYRIFLRGFFLDLRILLCAINLRCRQKFIRRDPPTEHSLRLNLAAFPIFFSRPSLKLHGGDGLFGLTYPFTVGGLLAGVSPNGNNVPLIPLDQQKLRGRRRRKALRANCKRFRNGRG